MKVNMTKIKMSKKTCNLLCKKGERIYILIYYMCVFLYRDD